MRLGFLGVGPWSQKLATAFRECGAEIVAHSRKSQRGIEVMASTRDITGFSEWVKDWRELVTRTDIDALILCAPPEVTTEAALACAKAGKRCVATKPLLWTEAPDLQRWYEIPNVPETWPGTMVYVDLWRLYSPAWIAMKEELKGKKIERIDVAFCGNGPFRSFPGVLDYGPHAMAFVFDLLGTTELAFERWYNPNGIGSAAEAMKQRGELMTLQAHHDGARVRVKIGNGAEKPERSVVVQTGGGLYTFDEPAGDQGENIYTSGEHGFELKHHKPLALRRFCRAFINGESSPTLGYSVAGMKVLERIAGDGP